MAGYGEGGYGEVGYGGDALLADEGGGTDTSNNMMAYPAFVPDGTTVGPIDNSLYDSDEDIANGLYTGEHSAWFYIYVEEAGERTFEIASIDYTVGPAITVYEFTGDPTTMVAIGSGDGNNPVTFAAEAGKAYLAQVTTVLPTPYVYCHVRPTSAPPHEGGNGFIRWSIHDPWTGETWVFPMNPNRMTSPHPAKSSTIFSRNANQVDDTTGISRVLQQRQSPYEWQFSGVIRTQQHYESLRDWARRLERLELKDHFGRIWSVRFDSVDINEQRDTARNPWRFEYTAKAIVYGRLA